MGINALGKMINSAGDFGPMIFGTGERLLLPFGLHHILVALIRFTEAGGTLDVCGVSGRADHLPCAAELSDDPRLRRKRHPFPVAG